MFVGLVVSTVVAFALMAWVMSYLRKFLKKSYKLQWLAEFRVGLLIHFVVMFVIFWYVLCFPPLFSNLSPAGWLNCFSFFRIRASLAILLLLRVFKQEFVQSVLALPGLRGAAVALNLFLFFLVALVYLFLLGYQSRGMWLADEIASLQLMERMQVAADE